MAFIEAHGLSKSFGSPVATRPRSRVHDGRARGVCLHRRIHGVRQVHAAESAGGRHAAGQRARSASTATPLRGIARQASIVFQNYSLLPWFSALENVRLAVDAARPAVVARRAEGTVGALSGSGRPRQRAAPPAEPAFRRHAAARRDRPRVRDRSRSAVSRRAVRRARRADARQPSAGARAALLRGRAAGDHGHDHEQPRRGAAALGPDHSDDAGTARDARIACRRRSRQTDAAPTSSLTTSTRFSPGPTSSSACPIICTRHATRARIARGRSRRRHSHPSPSKRRAYEHHRPARADRPHEGISDRRRARSWPSRTSTSAIQKSEFICIVGHSGCGKSTVLSIIAGLQRATEGGVVINGQADDRARRRSRSRLSDAVAAAVAHRRRQNVELAVRQKFRTLTAAGTPRARR